MVETISGLIGQVFSPHYPMFLAALKQEFSLFYGKELHTIQLSYQGLCIKLGAGSIGLNKTWCSLCFES